MLGSILKIRQCGSKLFYVWPTRSQKNFTILVESRRKIVSRGYVSVCSFSHLDKYSKKLCQVSRIKFNSTKNFSDSSREECNAVEFEKISDETLESLTEYFDEIIEAAEHLEDADVSYGIGVLTIKLGDDHGTYVINRQSPNKQIWLSSPKSGPKRYDFIDNTWIYKHDGKSLHELLDEEIPVITRTQTSFSDCAYGKRLNK